MEAVQRRWALAADADRYAAACWNPRTQRIRPLRKDTDLQLDPKILELLASVTPRTFETACVWKRRPAVLVMTDADVILMSTKGRSSAMEAPFRLASVVGGAEARRTLRFYGMFEEVDFASSEGADAFAEQLERRHRAGETAEAHMSEQRQQAAIAENRRQKSFLIVTMNDIPGYVITEVHGDVFGLTVRARNMFANFGARLGTVVGGEIHGYTKLLADARAEARERLIEEATGLGANAVIAFRFDSSEIGEIMSEIVAYGTAVTVRKSETVDSVQREGRPRVLRP